ncbi:MAG TPA: helix-turn-helix domain-containing protein [Labilithrix sp.]|nr:helix-turn-helix domain-containing protein [Labilithrix sp.]
MARPPKETASPSTLAPALLRMAAARGADAALLAAQSGLELADAERDELAVTPTRLATMLRGTCDLLADPHGALRFPAELPMRRYDAVTLALRAAGTRRAIFELSARYAPLIFPQLEVVVDGDDDEVRFAARIGGHPRGLGHCVDEYVLAFVLGHCRRGGAEVIPRRAWLASARPRTLEPLFDALGTADVAFGAASTGLALSRACATRELPGGDPMMLVTADHLASAALASAPRAGALAAVVAKRIEDALTADPSTEAIAAALQMSARTLQRRLEDEGTRFSVVLELARERVARRLLADRALPLGEVAYQVGFADLASFSRAFKRWTGLPPGAFRRRL